MRRINFLTPDMFPYTTLSGEHYDTGEYEKPLDHALDGGNLGMLAGDDGGNDLTEENAGVIGGAARERDEDVQALGS